MSSFDSAFWAAALRPFLLLVILVTVGIPITMALKRWMPESKTKRVLLDRTLMTRKPWVGWLGVILGYAFLYCVLWLIVWINGPR